jgi:hypothetical protein
LNEKKECTVIRLKSVRMGIFLIILLLAAMVMIPTVNGEDKNISINITAPEEGDVFYLDVVPAFISVQGTIDAPYGIRNVSITNGGDVVVCGSNYGIHFDISCDVPCYSDTDHITVSVVDLRGNHDSATRNFTRYTGPPPPGTIWVTGWIIDPKGQPVSNASVIFERMNENNPVVVTTKTGSDGMYKMKKAIGFYQRVTVQKEEYQTFVREVRFKEYSNEFNITLTPQGKSVPGFNS